MRINNIRIECVSDINANLALINASYDNLSVDEQNRIYTIIYEYVRYELKSINISAKNMSAIISKFLGKSVISFNDFYAHFIYDICELLANHFIDFAFCTYNTSDNNDYEKLNRKFIINELLYIKNEWE